jgi:tetratricopeptide (TPR) repeat protein
VAALARALGSGELLARAALGAGGVGVTILDVDRGLVALLEEGLDALAETAPALRARLLARLATELYYSGNAVRERCRELTAEALTAARKAGDPAALTETLAARHVALWDPRMLDERLAVAEELIALGARHREAELRGRHWRFVDLMELGEVEQAREELGRYEALAAELRMPAFGWYVPLWRASLAILEGRYDEAARLSDEALAAGHRAEDPNAEVFHVVQQAAIFFEQGRFAEFGIPDMVNERVESESASVAWLTGMSWVYAMNGREEEARELLARLCADDLALVPWDANRAACLAELSEAACALGEARHGVAIEAALEPWADRNLVNARAVTSYGSAHYFLGRLAELRGDCTLAARRFDAAVARNESFGAGPRTALARRALERVTSAGAESAIH